MAKRRDRDMAEVVGNRSEMGDRSGETQGGSGGVQGRRDNNDRDKTNANTEQETDNDQDGERE